METLIATKRFMNGGIFVDAGETFKVKKANARDFISRNLAKPAHQTKEDMPDETKAPDPEVEGIPDPTILTGYTVTKLKQIAKANGIKGYSKMREKELLEALTAAR